MQLAGRRALVTGASGGLGHAIARELRAGGADLVLHGRRREPLEALEAELDGEVVVADLADRDATSTLLARTADVDIVIVNAGVGASGDVLALDPDEIDRVLEVNLRVPVQMARFYGERMATRRSGHIVFISSLAAKASTRGSELYSATKAGLRMFAVGLHDSLTPLGVGVSCVLPGFVRDAGMFADSVADLPPYVQTVTPEAVGRGVRDSIERARWEVTIAPPLVRAGANLAYVAPAVASFLTNHTPLGSVRPD